MLQQVSIQNWTFAAHRREVHANNHWEVTLLLEAQKLSQGCTIILSKLFQSCPKRLFKFPKIVKVLSKSSRSYLKVLPKLSNAVSKVSRSSHEMVLKMSKSCGKVVHISFLKVILEMSQSCSNIKFLCAEWREPYMLINSSSLLSSALLSDCVPRIVWEHCSGFLADMTPKSCVWLYCFVVQFRKVS